MLIPPGYSEESVILCINYICNSLANSFTFGYFDIDDIKQEIRVFCLRALPKYDESRGKLSTFLMRCCMTRLINFRRDLLFRMPPTCKCVQCLAGNPCEYLVKRMDKWKKINTRKRNLMIANNIGDNDYEGDFSLTNFINKQEVIQLIDENLDVSLREDYRKLLDGVKISSVKRIRVFDEIKKILQNYLGEQNG